MDNDRITTLLSLWLVVLLGLCALSYPISVWKDRRAARKWPDQCENGTPGCRGYRESDPCERCHYDSFL